CVWGSRSGGPTLVARRCSDQHHSDGCKRGRKPSKPGEEERRGSKVTVRAGVVTLRSKRRRPGLLRCRRREFGPDVGPRSISAGVYSRAPEVHYVKERRGRTVKKLSLVALAAIGGLLVYRQIQADRAEQDLWTEATDSVSTGS